MSLLTAQRTKPSLRGDQDQLTVMPNRRLRPLCHILWQPRLVMLPYMNEMSTRERPRLHVDILESLYRLCQALAARIQHWSSQALSGIRSKNTTLELTGLSGIGSKNTTLELTGSVRHWQQEYNIGAHRLCQALAARIQHWSSQTLSGIGSKNTTLELIT